MEKIWEHTFNFELRIDPSSRNVLLTEIPFNPKENREKMTQIMFETFKVKGLFINNPAILSLYGCGKFSGIVGDLGEGITQVSPVFDGYPIPHASTKLDFAGGELTEFLGRLLIEGRQFSTFVKKEIVQNIKENVCYVALKFEKELKSVEPIDYILPDGNKIIVKNERIKCPEALFDPSIMDNNGKGIGQTIYEAIEKCDVDSRKDLYKNIIISGGTSLLNGLAERLKKEIKNLAPVIMKKEVNVIARPERKFTSWIGGSILSSISTFEYLWITKSEYEESGVSIVQRKCF